MILDKLKNLELYRELNPLFAIAFDYLRGTDLSKLAPGRYEIQDAEVYALVQEYRTRARSQGRWEAHRNHIDLHFMLSGEEIMGVANVADLKSVGDYDAAKDAEHLEGEGIFLSVPEGWFIIFGTEDAHMPCLEPGRASAVSGKISGGAPDHMECGGRRSPMLFQESWRRRFGSPAERED